MHFIRFGLFTNAYVVLDTTDYEFPEIAGKGTICDLCKNQLECLSGPLIGSEKYNWEPISDNS